MANGAKLNSALQPEQSQEPIKDHAQPLKPEEASLKHRMHITEVNYSSSEDGNNFGNSIWQTQTGER